MNDGVDVRTSKVDREARRLRLRLWSWELLGVLDASYLEGSARFTVGALVTCNRCRDDCSLV